MIKSSTGLKAKVRNLSGGEDKVAKAYIRIFFMERFMERLSVSKYRDQFILKGGMLVSSLLGINFRATMDIDTTVRAIPLSISDIRETVSEIFEIQLDDNVSFRITNIETIMDDFEYPGVRVHLEANLERLKQAIKIDVSTDDVITPDAVEYEYKLLFEDRIILLRTYNVETMIAEKIQTVIARGTANTRMRDFYDIYMLSIEAEYSEETVKEAFIQTCKKRNTVFTSQKIISEIDNISKSELLREQWIMFRGKNYYVGDLDFAVIADSVISNIRKFAGV